MGIYVCKATAIHDLLIEHFPTVRTTATFSADFISYPPPPVGRQVAAVFVLPVLRGTTEGCCLRDPHQSLVNAGICQDLIAPYDVQADDFGSEVIPGAKDMGMHIQAYLYDGYWEDIGTVEAFYEANLALTDDPVPKFRWGVFTD